MPFRLLRVRICVLASTHARAHSPLHGFQGPQGHCDKLPLPSSFQGRLRKQQELRASSFDFLGRNTILQTQWDCPEGMARMETGPRRLDPEGLEMRFHDPKEGQTGLGLSGVVGGVSAQSQQHPPPPQSELSETRP